MNVIMEKSERGTVGFPFQIYRDYGKEPGRLIASAHYHNEIEIMKPQRGHTTLIIDGTVMDAEPDRLYFINPSEIHAMYAATPCLYHCVVFSKELLSFTENSVIFKRLIEPLFLGEIRFPSIVDDAYCCQLFDTIDNLAKNGEKYAPQIVANLLLLFGYCEENGILQETTVTSRLKEPIHRAIRYMEKNYTEQLTLTKIAEQAGMTPKYFCSYFKKYTGTTAITFLNTLRIRKAEKLLLTGKSVLDSAFSCGFENTSFFIKKFKELTGKTPGQYKREHLTV